MFKEEIERYLVENHMSQAAFGDMIGVSQQTVNYWINGQRYPRASMFLKISDIIGVPVDELMREAGEKNVSA